MTSHETVMWYLRETTGTSFRLRGLLDQGQRYGQAFYNSLSREDRDRLDGTLYDTFHKDSPFDCYLAIENVLCK